MARLILLQIWLLSGHYKCKITVSYNPLLFISPPVLWAYHQDFTLCWVGSWPTWCQKSLPACRWRHIRECAIGYYPWPTVHSHTHMYGSFFNVSRVLRPTKFWKEQKDRCSSPTKHMVSTLLMRCFKHEVSIHLHKHLQDWAGVLGLYGFTDICSAATGEAYFWWAVHASELTSLQRLHWDAWCRTANAIPREPHKSRQVLVCGGREYRHQGTGLLFTDQTWNTLPAPLIPG